MRGMQFLHEYSTDRRRSESRAGAAHTTTSRPKNSAAGHWYQPSTAKRFQRAMSGLWIDTAEYSVRRFGCGKGTALVLAARAGFRRVIGVEIVPELLAAAQDNAEISPALTFRAANRLVVRART